MLAVTSQQPSTEDPQTQEARIARAFLGPNYLTVALGDDLWVRQQISCPCARVAQATSPTYRRGYCRLLPPE